MYVFYLMLAENVRTLSIVRGLTGCLPEPRAYGRPLPPDGPGSVAGRPESGKVPRRILVDLFFGVVVQGPKISCGSHNVT